MSVQLLDKTRKINKLLHNNNSSKVVFNDICQVLTEILDSNILVISRKGKVLGVSLCPGVDEIKELIDDEVGGYIDRLDMMIDPNTHEEAIRVVDYKTGKEASRNVTDVQSVFTRKDIGALHANYYLQAMLYSLIIRHNKQHNPQQLPVSPALLFIQHSQRAGYDPVLTFKKDKVESRISDIKTYELEFKENLSMTLNEIFDASRPFYPTTDNANCTNCPYRQLCRMNRSF